MGVIDHFLTGMILQVPEMSTNPIGFLNPSLLNLINSKVFPPSKLTATILPLEDHPIKELEK